MASIFFVAIRIVTMTVYSSNPWYEKKVISTLLILLIWKPPYFNISKSQASVFLFPDITAGGVASYMKVFFSQKVFHMIESFFRCYI